MSAIHGSIDARSNLHLMFGTCEALYEISAIEVSTGDTKTDARLAQLARECVFHTISSDGAQIRCICQKRAMRHEMQTPLCNVRCEDAEHLVQKVNIVARCNAAK